MESVIFDSVGKQVSKGLGFRVWGLGVQSLGLGFGGLVFGV